MIRRKTGVLAVAGAVITLAAAACSSGGSSSGTPTGSATAGSGGFNAAVNGTVNPSTTKGGPVVFANSTGPDSTDAGNTYYAFNLNFTRLYATPLTTYKSCTGACGQQVVPALATALGTATNGNKTWTYHLKSGVKFEDGTPVTSQDVKYAVERTFDRTVLPSGPSYFASLLAGNAAKYPGPFKNRSQNLMGLTSVQTPDPTTIVFQLKQPFADFNYVVAFPQTRPGAAGQGHGHELPAPPDVHRPVHVPELPAQQAVHAGAQPAVEPVLGPPGGAACQQDHG